MRFGNSDFFCVLKYLLYRTDMAAFFFFFWYYTHTLAFVGRIGLYVSLQMLGKLALKASVPFSGQSEFAGMDIT